MKSLIIKDLMFMKTIWVQWVFLFFGSLAISVAMGNYLAAICVLPLIILSSGVNTFQTDEFYNTESYTLSFPLSRKKIILSKYLFTLILLLIATYIGLIIYLLVALTIKPGFNGLNVDMIKYLVMLEASSLIVDALFYPIIYRFGCEKAKTILITAVVVLLGVVAILSYVINTYNMNVDFTGVLSFIQNYGVYVLVIAVTILMIISYFVSVLLYKRRDY